MRKNLDLMRLGFFRFKAEEPDQQWVLATKEQKKCLGWKFESEDKRSGIRMKDRAIQRNVRLVKFGELEGS